jgi:hypothetical protein
MAEAAASGDTNVGPTNVKMSPAATEAAEVTTGEVGTAKTSKMTSAKMTSTSVASASVASASTSSQGHRRNCCGTTQKGSCQNHRHCFSNHRSLLHRFSKYQDCCTRWFFPRSK